MSGTTFPCPHCGVTYPLKPVLMGKVVRCAACKKPFRLRPDGTAEAVAEAPPAPAAAAPSPTPPPTTASTQRRPTERVQLSGRQQDLRREMAASLTTAMGKALAAEAPPAAEASAKPGSAENRPTEARARQRTTRTLAVPGKDGKRKPGPAVLTGEGEREAAESRRWILGALGVLALVAGLGWLLTLDGPRREALDAYAAPVAAADTAYGRRGEAIRARAWLLADQPGGPPMPALFDLGPTRLDRVHQVPGTALAETLRRIGSLAWHPPLRAWVDDPAAAAKALAALKTRDEVLAKAEERRLTLLTPEQLARQLGQDGIDGEDAALVVRLALGETAPGRNAIAERARSAPPERIDWCAFSGDAGQVLIDTGSAYRTAARPYRGILLRFHGPGWADGGWKVLWITLAAAEG